MYLKQIVVWPLYECLLHQADLLLFDRKTQDTEK